MGKSRRLIELFWAFFRIGPATFGGGYAMIPMIEKEAVSKRDWIKEEEMNELLAIAGSAPGGVGVNVAAFIGYRLAGVAGACAAVLGITLPTFIVALLFFFSYSFFEGNIKVEAALKGVHAAVIALVLVAGYRLAKSAIFDKTTIAIAILSLAVLAIAQINPIIVIATGTLVGLASIRIKSWLGVDTRTHAGKKLFAGKETRYPEYYI
ncbi:chromate transporter [Cohnella sp. NL03-T5]|nr:chromate transporter [Cohnella silvisoli]